MPVELAGRPIAEVKKEELRKLVDITLTQLHGLLQQSTQPAVMAKIDMLMRTLSKAIETKLNELKTQMTVTVPILTPPTTPTVSPPSVPVSARSDDGVVKAYWQGGGGVNEPKPKKRKYKVEPSERLGPRGDGEKLPMYWKRNMDYLEGPYSNLDKMEGHEITDYEHTMKDDGRYKKKKK